jgi:hypothetical protein
MTVLQKLKSLFGAAQAFPDARMGGTTGPARDAITRAEWYGRIAFPPDTCREIESQARLEGLDCRDFLVDEVEFHRWRASCEDLYPAPPPHTLPPDIRVIAASLRTEKFLEYFVTLALTGLQPGAVVADIGSAQSKFLEIVVDRIGITGWAVDPALEGLQPSVPGIRYVPELISSAAERLPELDAVVLHCSFEMFEPVEMAAVIRMAASRLRRGGRLVIAPLYLEDRRTVYLDALKEAAPDRLAGGSTAARLAYVEDYWGLEWSEWLSAKDLADRLVRPFGALDFTLYNVRNASAIDTGAFLRFIGVWEKTNG